MKYFKCCNIEQEPEYIFSIDNNLYLACYCGICDHMIVLGYNYGEDDEN